MQEQRFESEGLLASGSSGSATYIKRQNKILVDCGLTGKPLQMEKIDRSISDVRSPFVTMNILTILKELGFWLVNAGLIYANEKHGLSHGWKVGVSSQEQRKSIPETRSRLRRLRCHEFWNRAGGALNFIVSNVN